MKSSIIIIICAGSLFVTSESIHNPTGQYKVGRHTHFPRVEHPKQPAVNPAKARMDADIAALRQELAELQKDMDKMHDLALQKKKSSSSNRNLRKSKIKIAEARSRT